MTYRRQRLAVCALAVMAGAAALAAPQDGRAATVSCPELRLLSEELTRSPAVFVGSVQAPIEADAGRGASLSVEETWRGPDLAPVVLVTIEDATGAPLLKLETGIRYLVAAEPSADTASSGATVAVLIVRACSVTRPWTPELADLRPPDARPMDGAAPTPTGIFRAAVPGWFWAGSAVILLAALGLALLAFSRRPALLPAAVVLGVAGIAVLGATVVLSLAPQNPAVGPSASTHAPAPSPSQEALPPDGRLVVRLEVMRDGVRPAVVSLHADGRLISAGSDGGDANLYERTLSPDGLQLVLEAMETTGLLGADAPAEIEYVPAPIGGGGPGGEITERLTFPAADGSTKWVLWTQIDPDDAEGVADAPEIERLETLAQQLLAPDGWLPTSAWVAAERSDYRADAFHALASQIPFGSARPAIDVSDLPAPLPASLGALEPIAPAPACVQLARSQATELLAAIADRFDRVDLTLAATSTDVAVDDAERSVTYRLSLRPLMPDEGQCPETAPAEPAETELAPGAIALVRVDALRVRNGAGSGFEAIDSFAAGDRVAVVAGPVAADGMDWYEVRQGPSGRGGHVARGPSDGDPWLVPIADGAIGFTEGDGSDVLSVGRMDPDGGGFSALVDGGQPVWSPDGRRFAFSVLQGQAGAWQLATAAPDGSQVSRLGEGEYPTWSPDGSLIAFGRGDEIWVMNADGGGQRLLVAGGEPWSLAWDPDGSRLAYMFPVETESGREGILFSPRALWFVDVVSGEITQITPADDLDGSVNPAWSPDGTRLAYGGNRLIDDSGVVVLELEIGVTWATAPWSPSGNELALMVDGSIEILELDSGERRKVTGTGLANQLVWSPDGSHLAFTSSRAGSDEWQIHVVNAGGGEPVPIGPIFGQSPAWQPAVSHGLD